MAEQHAEQHDVAWMRAERTIDAAAGPERVVLRAEDIDYQYSASRNTHRADLIGPELGFDVKSMRAFIAEIAPGARTSLHRHLNEAIIHILSGSGYSLIDGKRHDWKAGDFLAIPIFGWHQHVNPDPQQPVRYLAIVNVPLMQSLGIWRVEERGPDGSIIESRDPSKG